MDYSGDVPKLGKETIDQVLLQEMKDVRMSGWRRSKRSFVMMTVFVVLTRRCTNFLTYMVCYLGKVTADIKIKMQKICRMRR